MDSEKFNSEVLTVNKFINIYCNGKKHENIVFRKVDLEFNEKTFNYEIKLCDKCFSTISYSYLRLQECPHEIKPRCRSCKKPCYEKPQWKELATVMRYSGVKLGLTKLKSKIKNIFL